jgi:hypothetical protein
MSFFQSQKINPVANPPMFPSLQQTFGNWLTSQVGQGAPAYPGQINADPTKSNLGMPGGVWDQAQQLQGPQALMQTLGVGQTPQVLQNAMSWGAQPGAAGQYESNMAQYGSPSQAGQGVSNLQQYGVASQGSGQALKNWSQITPQMASQFLLPYLAGQNPAAYRPPSI